jgi:hypothetical protein
VPFTHAPVQHSGLVVHAEPVILHSVGDVWHVSGTPPHCPLQQSSFVPHVAPAAAHAEVQIVTPPSPARHEPLQHVSPAPQGESRGRQGPGPRPHRPTVESQAPQQGGTVSDPLHSSPVGRHSVAESTHVPNDDAHSPEQQSLSSVHDPPAMAQSAPPHVPPLQASEQQSAASLHAAPSMAQ